MNLIVFARHGLPFAADNPSSVGAPVDRLSPVLPIVNGSTRAAIGAAGCMTQTSSIREPNVSTESLASSSQRLTATRS